MNYQRFRFFTPFIRFAVDSGIQGVELGQCMTPEIDSGILPDWYIIAQSGNETSGE